MVEQTWLTRAQLRSETILSKVATHEDALGAVDGIKDGEWGFHTDMDSSPWWQVDLEQWVELDHVLLWNRCSGACAERNRHLILLLSEDGQTWTEAYQHDGTPFYGFSDGKPLKISLKKNPTRFVRLQIMGPQFLHLDEVEVFGLQDPQHNLALGRPADQSSVSAWSTRHRPESSLDWKDLSLETLERCANLSRELAELGAGKPFDTRKIHRLRRETKRTNWKRDGKSLFLRTQWLARELLLRHPILDFDSILITKRVPGSFNHMSDQYYGWWSRPGGGIFRLDGFRERSPRRQCLTDDFPQQGSFLRPMLSFEGDRLLFSWCKHYPGLRDEQNKLDKSRVPSDAFYHVFEMDLSSGRSRQLTFGKYDDFDARYLPDGRIVFLSTRRGQFLQCGRESAALTCRQEALPDCYVRCGGGPERPVAVYTLHTMDARGGDLHAISPFEMFEWTPNVGHDGTILYSRWDYVDRDNMPYMGLWSIHPDGTHSRIVYGNFTKSPHCTFEPHPVPESNKIVFTASAHHAQTMGSLVLLDPTVGSEGEEPIERLTPEVLFPEIEGWPPQYFASPWPLSERFHLVSWGLEPNVLQGRSMASSGMGIYLFDAQGGMELLYKDPNISSTHPIPYRARPAPPILPPTRNHEDEQGRFVLMDVYDGLSERSKGKVKQLRIVAVPAKTHPTMDYPSLGLTADDPGKCVLGTIPVEEDGSAYFRAPAGVCLFFQALDAEGMAIRTMRSATHVQPGQTLSCIGCHEPRHKAPQVKPALAVRRAPSPITKGPPGSWPLRFDQLVQPVLDRACVRCHGPEGMEKTRSLDLTHPKSYETLTQAGTPSLREHVQAGYREGRSLEGATCARQSPILRMLFTGEGHPAVEILPKEKERLIVWADTYAQRLGSFGQEQEEDLLLLRERWSDLLQNDQDETGRK